MQIRPGFAVFGTKVDFSYSYKYPTDANRKRNDRDATNVSAKVDTSCKPSQNPATRTCKKSRHFSRLANIYLVIHRE